MTFEDFLTLQKEKKEPGRRKKGFLKSMLKAQLSMLKKQWQISKLFFMLQLAEAVLDGIVPSISVYLSKFLVEKLLDKDWHGTLFILCCILSLNIFNYVLHELISYSMKKTRDLSTNNFLLNLH